jgi:hypothetical protein
MPRPSKEVTKASLEEFIDFLKFAHEIAPEKIDAENLEAVKQIFRESLARLEKILVNVVPAAHAAHTAHKTAEGRMLPQQGGETPAAAAKAHPPAAGAKDSAVAAKAHGAPTAGGGGIHGARPGGANDFIINLIFVLMSLKETAEGKDLEPVRKMIDGFTTTLNSYMYTLHENAFAAAAKAHAPAPASAAKAHADAPRGKADDGGVHAAAAAPIAPAPARDLHKHSGREQAPTDKDAEIERQLNAIKVPEFLRTADAKAAWRERERERLVTIQRGRDRDLPKSAR